MGLHSIPFVMSYHLFKYKHLITSSHVTAIVVIGWEKDYRKGLELAKY